MIQRYANKREQIIFREPEYNEDKYPGGIRQFGLGDGISKECLSELLKNDFADPDTSHGGPSIRDFLEFAENHKGRVEFEGFAVATSRTDYYPDNQRFELDGIDFFPADVQELADFSNAFHDANEFEVGTVGECCRAWWD